MSGSSARAVRVVTVAITIIIAGYYLGGYMSLWPRFASGVTRAKILALRPGMPCNQVVKILGKPLVTSHGNVIDKAGKIIKITAYDYGLSGLFFDEYEIGVGCRENVIDIVGIEYGDFSVYLCSSYACPKVIRPELFKKLRNYID